MRPLQNREVSEPFSPTILPFLLPNPSGVSHNLLTINEKYYWYTKNTKIFSENKFITFGY
jgi:hypothetical protein